MKTFVLFFGLLVIVSCNTNDEISKKEISLTNTLQIERLNEPIVISLEKIKSLYTNGTKSGSFYFENSKGVYIPFQKDTFSGNSNYCLSLDFKASETKSIYVINSDKKSEKETVFYTNIRLGKDKNSDGVFSNVTQGIRDPKNLPGVIPVIYQAEGISWENDKVGFRSYWDKRNTKDVWGKTTSKMVLDSVGLPNTPSYHEIQDWGADVLKVGNSLGAGGLAIKIDSVLYRLGKTDSATFSTKTEGPLRSVLSLYYKGWNVLGKSYNLEERITIWKGKYWYKSELFIEGASADENLVTGIVNINLKNDRLHQLKPNSDKTILYTFDKQSEYGDNLGLALILNTDELVNVVKAPNTGTGRSIDGNSAISHTFYAELNQKKKPISFYFAAGWERSNKEFATQNGFENMLIDEANKLNNPIIIK